MSAQDVIAESTAKLVRSTKDPAMWSRMSDDERRYYLEEAQAALEALAAAGYAVVKLPDAVHRCDRDVAWICDDEIQVDYDTRDGIWMSWPDGTQVFGPWPADRALDVGAALIAAHTEAGEHGE
ncbi:hypothetical protein [Gordonia sp. (in: high G+C Gram-positive bacteria)]|uniref:hypothetical protein n=1 Tax=Gordonia sp. (in: high G+C Gram-positive bacteria) TaxID=84139 RepID=UPI00333ED5CB